MATSSSRFLLACLPLAVACGNASFDASSAQVDGALHGELRVYRVDYDDGHSEREFFLSPDEHSSQMTRLIFASDPELEPWTRLKVWGAEGTDGVSVARFEPEATAAAGEGVAVQELVSPMKRSQTVGFVLMDVGSGVNLTADAAKTAVFGTRTPTGAGLNQYYSEVSYGGFGFTGDILGPVTITTLGTCQQSAITMIENGWAAQFGKQYDHWMTYIGSQFASCGWAGIGGEGTAARPAYGSWYNGSAGCTVLAQEVGHNLGMMHSGSLSCSGQSFADDPHTCSGSEYGDRNTVMGSGCAHLGAYEKWYEGFLGGCNAVRATASGTYTLLPTETPCDGVQALQIPMPKSRGFHNTSGTNTEVTLSKYYLELRTKTGIDGAVSAPFVMVTVAGDIAPSNKASTFTWILDMKPSTANSFDGMALAQTFTDPAGGVSFTVKELDASHATIQVTVDSSTGAATCMDGTPFVGPGPASCGGAPPGDGGAGGSAGSGGTMPDAGSDTGASTGTMRDGGGTTAGDSGKDANPGATGGSGGGGGTPTGSKDAAPPETGAGGSAGSAGSKAVE